MLLDTNSPSAQAISRSHPHPHSHSHLSPNEYSFTSISELTPALVDVKGANNIIGDNEREDDGNYSSAAFGDPPSPGHLLAHPLWYVSHLLLPLMHVIFSRAQGCANRHTTHGLRPTDTSGTLQWILPSIRSPQALHNSYGYVYYIDYVQYYLL